uniref:Uncharacterized protein n=1 Tax=Arundo donax TaxID=35708 RepID=A0A0A8ZX44_ARUDO
MNRNRLLSVRIFSQTMYVQGVMSVVRKCSVIQYYAQGW